MTADMVSIADSWLAVVVGWIGTFFVTIIVAAWKARGIQADIMARIADGDDVVRREVGEGLAALRTKTGDIELLLEREFVRKEDFQAVVTDFHQMVDRLRSSNQANFDKLSDKLDRVLQQRVTPN
jgi:hypothetical protein